MLELMEKINRFVMDGTNSAVFTLTAPLLSMKLLAGSHKQSLVELKVHVKATDMSP